jgi:hypothetical protein
MPSWEGSQSAEWASTGSRGEVECVGMAKKEEEKVIPIPTEKKPERPPELVDHYGLLVCIGANRFLLEMKMEARRLPPQLAPVLPWPAALQSEEPPRPPAKRGRRRNISPAEPTSSC